MPEARVAAVFDYLLVLAGSIDGVTVLDGDTGTRPTADVIAIGYGLPANVVATESFGTVSVACALWAWSATADYAPLRQRCQDLLNQFADDVEQDPGLGGACDEARLGTQTTWQQETAGSDSFVTVEFTIVAKTDV